MHVHLEFQLPTIPRDPAASSAEWCYFLTWRNMREQTHTHTTRTPTYIYVDTYIWYIWPQWTHGDVSVVPEVILLLMTKYKRECYISSAQEMNNDNYSHCIAPYRIIILFFTSKKRNTWLVNILPNWSITPRTRTSETLVLFATRLLLVKSSWNDVEDSVKIDDPTLYFTTKPFQ